MSSIRYWILLVTLAGCALADSSMLMGLDPTTMESVTQPITNCPHDGFFSYGNCSDQFYACSNDRVIPMFCPALLAFDESRQLCDYPFAVEECQSESSGSGSGESSGENSGESSGEGGSGESSGLGSGEGSGSIDGSGLVIPMESEQAEVAVEAGDASGDELLKGDAGDSATGVEALSQVDAPVLGEVTIDGEDSKCMELPDGFYSSGCSSRLTACVAHHAYVLNCPADLVYDQKNGYCDYPAGLDECSNESAQDQEFLTATGSSDLSQDQDLLTATESAIVRRAEAGPSATSPAYAAYVATTTASESEDDEDLPEIIVPKEDVTEAVTAEASFPCQEEGAFSTVDCSDTFTYCTSGKGMHLQCDFGLLFSRIESRCLPATEMAECLAANIY